jgi:hypothetical protein
MSAPHPRPEGPGAEHDALRPEESFLRGGIKGVALVTLATAALAGAGALVALVIALLF